MIKTLDDISSVLVVGAGTLGSRIALRCALDGYVVKVYDLSQEQLAAAQNNHAYLVKVLLRDSKVSAEQVEQAKANLSFTTDIELATTDVDLVSESIVENIDVKRAFYADFAPRLEKGVVVTTNTSFLMPSKIADCLPEPELFCGFHFHDVFNQVVVDVMPHPDTAIWVNDLLMEFGCSINQIPVFIRKENPGYIFNSIFGQILRQSLVLFVDGVGSVEDIDRSFMGNFGTMAGPFGMLDQIGFDTAWHIMSVDQDADSQKAAKLLKSYIDDGKLGFKTGQGFYSYPRPAFTQENFLRG
ncbi:MAG: 3-hydroxybutyryl-CoA dehydrogenase [Cryomorphaceae bacterium]|jgi:3-hydroxybutyryl-CoA dehydrogenase